MSYINRVFDDQFDLLSQVETELIAEGWTLEYSGIDNGNTDNLIKVFRDYSDRFSIGFRYSNKDLNEFNYDGQIFFNIMLNYNAGQNLMSQTDGLNYSNNSIGINKKSKFNGIIKATNRNIFINTNQYASTPMNMYIGSMNPYKPTELNNEDLCTLSGDCELISNTNEIYRDFNGNFINNVRAYSESSWGTSNSVDLNVVEPNIQYVTPNDENTFTFFPAVIFDRDNYKTLGELEGLYFISSMHNSPGYTFNYNGSDYIVIDINNDYGICMTLKTN